MSSDSEPATHELNQDQLDKENQFYEIETLVGHRQSKRNPGTLEYRVKWKNYADRSNTWEPERNISAPGLIKAYWDRRAEPQEQQPIRKTAKLSDLPPAGMQWSDLVKVVQVFEDKGPTHLGLLAQLKWPHGKITYCRTATIKEKSPDLLIDFYEDHLITWPRPT